MIELTMRPPAEMTLSPLEWPPHSGMSLHLAAQAWVEAAIAANLAPTLVQRPLGGDDAGEWRIRTARRDSRAGEGPGALSQELFDEAVLVLEARGDVVPAPQLKSWHGTVLQDNCSPRAVALRLRLARRCLGLSEEAFYGRNPILASMAFDRSSDETFLGVISEFNLSELCRRHGVPEEWVYSGTPDEIELTECL